MAVTGRQVYQALLRELGREGGSMKSILPRYLTRVAEVYAGFNPSFIQKSPGGTLDRRGLFGMTEVQFLSGARAVGLSVRAADITNPAIAVRAAWGYLRPVEQQLPSTTTDDVRQDTLSHKLGWDSNYRRFWEKMASETDISPQAYNEWYQLYQLGQIDPLPGAGTGGGGSIKGSAPGSTSSGGTKSSGTKKSSGSGSGSGKTAASDAGGALVNQAGNTLHEQSSGTDWLLIGTSIAIAAGILGFVFSQVQQARS